MDLVLNQLINNFERDPGNKEVAYQLARYILRTKHRKSKTYVVVEFIEAQPRYVSHSEGAEPEINLGFYDTLKSAILAARTLYRDHISNDNFPVDGLVEESMMELDALYQTPDKERVDYVLNALSWHTSADLAEREGHHTYYLAIVEA